MTGKVTPMLAQYLEIKGRHPDALLLFRMGDFFETFFDDAHTLARVAGVQLTTRDRNSDHPVPLAGVPHHALDVYLTRLLAAGLTVAICEQIEDPAAAKGLVRRDVVEIISPGTACAPQLLPGATASYCLAWSPARAAVPADGTAGESGWALLDVSTGEFVCGQESAELAALCERHPVREVIVAEDLPGARVAGWRAALPGVVVNPVSGAWFHPALATQTLLGHFQVAGLEMFGLARAGRELAGGAAGALLRYVTSLALRRPEQVTSLRFSERGDRLLLDEETLRNLEVFRTLRGERGPGTLIHHIDATVTPPGRRLLERRLAEPLTDLAVLGEWHAGVAGAVIDREWRQRLRAILGGLGDLERWAARAAAGRCGPAQLRQLALSLRAVAALAAAVGADGHATHPAARRAAALPPLDDLTRRLLDTLTDDPPAAPRAGGAIRPGFDPELDAQLALARDTRGYLAGLQARERERTGIATLKVGYNRVFGYYYEITSRHLDKAPADYQQRQTLVNAARFVTPELTEAERRIAVAEQESQRREALILEALQRAVADRLAAIAAAARTVGEIDLMLAFAELAEQRDWCRPVCDDSLGLDIEQGRHPVVEALLDHDFIPNDTALDGEARQLLLLTGPNMGGKSTYLRQTAVIVLLAQAGSFVPARAARIGVTDRVFTRVGASDNVARGQSTFFVEMAETAHILRQMTRRSLVILDEIGRGTATYDGLSLAWAITEHLHDPRGPRPRTIFATHYHELCALEDQLPGLVNLRLEVREWEGRIVFLHAVQPGRSDRSYGIHVARLAGVPEPVLKRAQEILEGLSLEDARVLATGPFHGLPGGASIAADSPAAPPLPRQLSLFTDAERDALAAFRHLDLDRLSPVDAFMWLAKLREQLS
jgi:DNA mismatch repair protein MutS